jgi:hypothetical protein
MLKDRRELIELEIRNTSEKAAKMYLNSVIGKQELDMEKYEALKNKIASLRFDLVMVKQLIDEGHN